MSVIGHAITRNFIPIASALLRYDTDLESINQVSCQILHLPNTFNAHSYSGREHCTSFSMYEWES